MSLFELYLQLGFKHIIDVRGYDHIVFVLALCAGYDMVQYKKVLILVTAFTVGHSITLVLSTLNYIIVQANIIEFLIPVTILITAVSNLLPQNKSKGRLVYFVALFFGLIHGMGFSNYLRNLLGKETSILQPLFSFNIGLEIGQVLILAVYFSLLLVTIKIFGMKEIKWKYIFSVAAAGIAIFLIFRNKIWL